MMTEEQLGDPYSKIWVVSGYPKAGDKAGPLSTTVGQRVVGQLQALGVSLTQVRFDYLVNEVPPKGHVAQGAAYFKQTGKLATGVEALQARLNQYKPNVVLGFGADVLYALHSVRTVSKWRGHPLWSDAAGCKCVFTHDPFNAQAQLRVPKEHKPGQFMALMEADIDRAVRERGTATIDTKSPDLVIGAKYHEVMPILEDMLANAKVISYDIEVFQPYDGRLMDCIGLADSVDRGLCIPFYVQSGSTTDAWWSPAEHRAVWNMVKRIMESNIPKVAQNSQFDTTMLKAYYDIDTKNLVWDTMIAQHSLYCDLPKDLGTLISLYTNLPYHKYMIHSVSAMDRWLYNAADAVANLHVMQGQLKEFGDLANVALPYMRNGTIPDLALTIPEVQHYFSVVNPTIVTTVDMHIHGVRVDPELRESVLSIEKGIMKQIRDALNLVIPAPLHNDKLSKEWFNPMSSSQKPALFYDVLGCPEQFVRRKLKCDKNALKNILQRERRPYVRTLLRACLAYRAADARLGKFKIEPDNGYIRTQYDVAGTDTGRLASKVSDVLTAGTNLQNIAKGPQRAMLIPEDGEEFALVDLYAAEAYLNALDAGEMKMLHMISGVEETDIVMVDGCRRMSAKTAEKYKIHNWMQRTTAEAKPIECEKFGYSYKEAKQSIHALNYGVTPPEMSRNSGLPLEVSSWQYDMYHLMFPGIRRRMARINRDIRQHKRLHSPLGRRRYFLMPVCKELFNMSYAWPSQSCIGEITEVAGNWCMNYSNMQEKLTGKPMLRPVLNTHDGLAIRIPKGCREEAISLILKAFNIPMRLNGLTITIPVSIGFGPNFNDMVDEDVYFYPSDSEDM